MGRPLIIIALTIACGLFIFWMKTAFFQSAPTTDLATSSQTDLQSATSAPPSSTPTAQTASSPLSKKVVRNLPETALNSKEQRQIEIFDEIMRSRNDNDPRMDKDLSGLSPAAKAALIRKYDDSPLESRNERGTIALLIGRELSSPSDLEFLKTILAEPPCLSLENCRSVSAAGGDEHSQNGIGITLVYPQLVTLKMLEGYLASSEKKSKEMSQSALEAILAARNSSNPTLSSAANQAMDHLQKK